MFDKNISKYEKQQTNQDVSKCDSADMHAIISIQDASKKYREKVTLRGEIFKITKNTTKNRMILYSIYITDYKNAIQAIYFFNNETSIPKLMIGQSVEIKGQVSWNKFSKKKNLICNGHPKIIEDFIQLKEDNAKTKRIELALRTNMSTQDGISTPLEYVKVAKFYGHRAIAITDLDSVQSFASFYNLVKKDKSIIPIYGATLSSIDTRNNIFYGFKKFDLTKEKYVVLTWKQQDLVQGSTKLLNLEQHMLKMELL